VEVEVEEGRCMRHAIWSCGDRPGERGPLLMTAPAGFGPQATLCAASALQEAQQQEEAAGREGDDG
jgi:hypothetical protein